jgi:hypothetical protein
MKRLLKCQAEALTGDSVNCKGGIAYQSGAAACDFAESLEHYCAAELRAQRL